MPIHPIFSSYPFITGDTFRTICDFYMEEDGLNFSPEDVFQGAKIFLKTDLKQLFFERIHPHIQNKYILITHNGDLESPGSFLKYACDQKLFMWFISDCGTNVCSPEVFRSYSNIVPIPLGLTNMGHNNVIGNTECYQNIAKENIPRTQWSYLNIAVHQGDGRQEVVDLFSKNTDFVTSVENGGKERISHDNYIRELFRHRFVFSPMGNPINQQRGECHRTWEALLSGCIPIVKEKEVAYLKSVYDELPVWIVKEWSDVTFESMQKTYTDFGNRTWKTERCYFPYWENMIELASSVLKAI